MLNHNNRILSLFLAAGILLACVPSIPLPAAGPTGDSSSIYTAIVQTADAAATQTAMYSPPTSTITQKPLPTLTPTITLTPTSTFIFLLPTPTVPSSTPAPGSTGRRFECQVVTKSPADNDHVSPNSEFTMTWQIMNTGSEYWDSGSSDFHYRSGTVLHLASIYDVETSLGTGEMANFSIPMKAPSAAGVYSTTWGIRIGQVEFCPVSITIRVP